MDRVETENGTIEITTYDPGGILDIPQGKTVILRTAKAAPLIALAQKLTGIESLPEGFLTVRWHDSNSEKAGCLNPNTKT